MEIKAHFSDAAANSTRRGLVGPVGLGDAAAHYGNRTKGFSSRAVRRDFWGWLA